MQRTLSVLFALLAALSLSALVAGCDVTLEDDVATTSSALTVEFDWAAPDAPTVLEVPVAVPVSPSRAPTPVQTRDYVETILIDFLSELDIPPGPCPSPHHAADRFVVRVVGPDVDPVEAEVIVPEGGAATLALPLNGSCDAAPCVVTLTRDAGEAGPVTVFIARR